MIWLVRAPGFGFCECPQGIACVPGAAQQQCPWCGCGWLFSCVLCRTAFGFAVAAEIDLDVEHVATLDRKGFIGEAPMLNDMERELVRRHDVAMQRAIGKMPDLELGQEYVVLDGRVLATGRTPGTVTGLYGRHELETLPHEVHRASLSADENPLMQRGYWLRAKRRNESRERKQRNQAS